jgi:hypothetical protein
MIEERLQTEIHDESYAVAGEPLYKLNDPASTAPAATLVRLHRDIGLVGKEVIRSLSSTPGL